MIWQAPPDELTLPPDEVHVWRARLDLPQARLRLLRDTLSPDEQERADRFVFQKHRDRFVAARGQLRALLGGYLAMAPQRLRFRYNQYGKPALEAPSTTRAVSFNLSHAQNTALYAVTWGRQIGIDLEYVQRPGPALQIAEHFFSPQEVAVLRGLPEHLQRDAFFRCWTRKEAYIKARGMGLSLPLDGFQVSLAPGEPAALLEVRDDSQEAGRWSLREIDPGAGCIAALAVEGHGWRLSCWQWS